jgi:hypothetical protein
MKRRSFLRLLGGGALSVAFPSTLFALGQYNPFTGRVQSADELIAGLNIKGTRGAFDRAGGTASTSVIISAGPSWVGSIGIGRRYKTAGLDKSGNPVWWRLVAPNESAIWQNINGQPTPIALVACGNPVRPIAPPPPPLQKRGCLDDGGGVIYTPGVHRGTITSHHCRKIYIP